MPKCDFNKVLGLVHWCFGIGALLSVCCIFSEHIFLRTPLDGCFWILYFASIYFVNVYDAKKLGMYFLQSKKTKSSHKNFYSFRSSHQRCSMQKVFLEISQESTCARVAFFNKVEAQRPATFLKKRIWHRCFPVNFVKFLRTSFCIEHTSGGYFCIVLNAKCLTFN